MKRKNAVVGTKVVHKESRHQGKIVAITEDCTGDQLLLVDFECAGIGYYYASELKKAEKVR